MKDVLRKEFEFLLNDYGFEFDEEQFDGLIVVYKNDSLSIEFTKDRSDFFVSVKARKSNKEYEDVYEVLAKMNKSRMISEVYSPNNRMNLAKKVLSKHLSQIQNYLESELI